MIKAQVNGQCFFLHKFHFMQCWQHANNRQVSLMTSCISHRLLFEIFPAFDPQRFTIIIEGYVVHFVLWFERTWMKPIITRTIFRHRGKLSIQIPAHRKDGKHFRSSFGRGWVQRLSSEMAWCWFVFYSKSDEIHPRLSSTEVLPGEIYS